MFSKHELKRFLEEISDSAAFVKFQFVSTDKFVVQLKCKVDGEVQQDRYNNYASEWIKKFSKFTATAWIVRTSFPKLKRLVYRKVFSCHRSSFNKKKQCTDETRNQGCRAKIDFKMKFINRNTIKNDPFLKEGLNMTISIDFLHSHKLRTQEAFNMLKSTPETDQLFYSYFENGYSPSMAKMYHELTVIDHYGDHPQYLMNANINPTARHVHYLHVKTKKADNLSNKSFDEIMSPKKASVENAGGFLNYDNPEVVSVITPTMRRVAVTINLEHILVDSIPTASGPVVTFLYAVSKAGALPIACVLHTEENEANYSQAFLSIKLTLENLFNGQFEPKLLNIKDCKEMRDAATAIFPNSIVLSSKWSVCSNIWRWICSDDAKMEVKQRQAWMENFWELIRCNKLESAESCYELYKEDDNETPSEVSDYIDDLWDRRVEWLNGEDHVSLNVVEASMRIMNEFVYQKCKFNVHVMVDVLINVIDRQIRRILHAHAKSLNVPATYTKFLEKTKEVMSLDSSLKRINTTEFKLESGSKTKKYIRFRTDIWCCDCNVGKKGRFCEHLCAVINVVDTDLMKTPELTDEEKCVFTEIAGEELEEKSLVKPEFNNEEEEEEEMDIDGIKEDDEIDDEAANAEDDDRCSVPSPKTEVDDGYYYLDVKTENCEGNDPLDEVTEVSNEEKYEEISFSVQNNDDIPSTSKVSKVDLKSQYEGAMKNLNNEFRRLNKYFKANPNKSNMDTMMRLARELGKIRPIERVDLGNMHIMVNKEDEN